MDIVKETEKQKQALKKTFYKAQKLNNLSTDEKILLNKYGTWLEMLMQYKLLPISPEQEKFIQEIRSITPSPSYKSDNEIKTVWVKYLYYSNPLNKSNTKNKRKAIKPKVQWPPSSSFKTDTIDKSPKPIKGYSNVKYPSGKIWEKD